MKKEIRKNIFLAILATSPSIIAMVEYLVFWWNNNGLHTSRYDFFMQHPVHSIVSGLIMFANWFIIKYYDKIFNKERRF